MLKILWIVLLAITNLYPQLSTVTLGSISITNFVTTQENFYNSFVIITKNEGVNKFK